MTAASPRWQHRPEGSTWGDFGLDDQRGRLNLITPEKVKQGVAEIREVLSFCLSLPLDYPGGNALNPRRHPPVLRPTVRDGRPNFNCVIEGRDGTDVFNDDLAILWLQYSTQWDSWPTSARCSTPTATGCRSGSTTTASALGSR